MVFIYSNIQKRKKFHRHKVLSCHSKYLIEFHNAIFRIVWTCCLILFFITLQWELKCYFTLGLWKFTSNLWCCYSDNYNYTLLLWIESKNNSIFMNVKVVDIFLQFSWAHFEIIDIFRLMLMIALLSYRKRCLKTTISFSFGWK